MPIKSRFRHQEIVHIPKIFDFRRIEPQLTFLNIPQLRRHDIRSKVEELEQLNQAMRDRDKLKDADLSDQLIALTARLDSIEKRL